MINSDETQAPEAYRERHINAADTVPPDGAVQSAGGRLLGAGDSVADSYIIHSLLDKQGKQSNVYLAKKWGKSYVVKVYHNGWRPSGQMQSFLRNVRHPNIARVIDSGDCDGYYYEIYEYYPEGTLEDAGALTVSHIQNVIVPSINEGLHELHLNNIVHCDIKPGNLFYTDDGKRVVIGDCGISGYVNANGKLVDAVRGTPEYAPRVKALLWSAAMSPAYDYGSFGLVLCRAVLGRSLFSGMSVEEIAGAWEDGLELPAEISGRIGDLIRGLLVEDEDKRWGYTQVKRWCEHEYVRPVNRNIYTRQRKEVPVKPLIFGRFDGRMVTVSTLHQLAQAIEAHWAQGTKTIKRRELYEFVRQFDKEKAEKVRELARCTDLDAAVYKLLVYIGDDPHRIVYCGKTYGSLEEYVESLASGKDETAKQFLMKKLLVFYLRYNGYEKSQVDQLEALIKRNSGDDAALILTICLALKGEKTFELYGETVDSLDELIPVLCERPIREIDELLGSDRFIAWLNRLGYERETRRMKELTV